MSAVLCKYKKTSRYTSFITSKEKSILRNVTERSSYTEESLCRVLGVTREQIIGNEPLSLRNKSSISLFIGSL